MLVVVLIIGMLAAMIMGAVIAVRRKFARDNTKMILVAISGAIERYQTDWSDFPPGAGGVAGSEELYAALSSTRYEGPYLKGDYPPTKDTDGNGRRELVDHWGRAIGYTHHRHYRGDPKADEYRLESDGADGKPGSSDDIANWKK
jgi:type II secretory pathway pseudopilin PulG